ncbi:histidine kinase [Thioclava sp. SK-1]|uniref:DUF294 nucleotidyltransferase-like domain-containing protein n=1 Tax=Thioclava sp. SK-1 TaxID=1889770 RepID=UPI000824CB2A|nr:DUF294 nucleotidyltransferase-like domain-containing protein [Thioclava sp. SK-1]OCX64488.1 histidine kinase [Thioclava sp. SK-1]
MDTLSPVLAFLEGVHPYDALHRDELTRVAGSFLRMEVPAGATIYRHGLPLDGLYLIQSGGVEVTDPNGALVSILGPRNSFGERGLMRDGLAVTTATACEDCVLLLLPAAVFHGLVQRAAPMRRFFTRARGGNLRKGSDLATTKLSDLLSRDPESCTADTTVVDAARKMRDLKISSLGVCDRDGMLLGVITQRDMSNKVVAGNFPPSAKVGAIMTADPVTLAPHALGSDILHVMLENRIGHLPITDHGRFVGMITQTDLTRFQAVSSAVLIRDVAQARTVHDLAQVTALIPQLLVQLVASHQSHEVVTRLITDIADAVTRRLLVMAQAELGAPPVPWLWLACGSQGRQDQTGVSDQDNCMIVDDAATPEDMIYFQQFAQIVSEGLNACGYVYCPGDMMASNPRWCQPLHVWQGYFRNWIATPSTEAQMLASVMFDLRAIGGPAPSLFHDLQAQTLETASKNSIFVAHMVANSLTHTPPLGLLRGFATIRTGEHRNQIDLKHNGVVPVADLARVYALRGRITEANTRNRLQAAEDFGVISDSGARDLIEAYDLIAGMRLENQSNLIRSGRAADNFLAPSDLSDFERSHLRDAFVVVRTMQGALGHGRVL